MINTPTAEISAQTGFLTTILEINKSGKVERCYGCEEACSGEMLYEVLGTREEAFSRFFTEVRDSEKQGLESFFSGENGITSHLRFMGRRDDTYLFIRTKSEWDHPDKSKSNFTELLQVLDPSGKILFTNRNWRDKIGFATELEKGDLSFAHLLLPEFLPKYEEHLRNFDAPLTKEAKVWGLKTEKGDNILKEK